MPRALVPTVDTPLHSYRPGPGLRISPAQPLAPLITTR